MADAEARLISRRTVLGVVLLSADLGACGEAREYCYRFVLEVEVDKRTVQGEVVQAYRYRPGTGKAGIDVGEARTIGEAMVLDLPGHGLLVATLAARLVGPPRTVPIGSGLWTAAQAISEKGVDPSGLVRKDLEVEFFRTLKGRGRVEVAAAELPILITFADPKDSRTVRQLVPLDLAVGIGPGVRFKNAWIEATDRRPTHGRLRAALPWALTEPGHIRFFSGGVGAGATLADTLSNQDLIGI
jgi:hypothetical protein